MKTRLQLLAAVAALALAHCGGSQGPGSPGSANHPPTVEPPRDAGLPGGVIDAGPDAPCVAETDARLCARQGKTCGRVSGNDNCGVSRVAACGSCQTPETCGGAGQQYVCGASCVAETDPAFCARLGKTCGSVQGTDNCGGARSVTCGTCSSPETCSSGVCVAPRNCVELWSCVIDCQDYAISNLRACNADCAQKSTQAAVNKFDAFYRCAKQYCPADGGADPNFQNCIAQNCSFQETACRSDDPHPRTLSCQTANICHYLCDVTDIHCSSDCLLKMNDVSVQQHNAVRTCAINNNCHDFACDRQYCSAEMTVCGLIGTASCSTTLNCINQAPDQNAVYVCYLSGSAAAQQGIDDFSRCQRQFQCRNQACDTQNCSTQIAACQNNTSPP